MAMDETKELLTKAQVLAGTTYTESFDIGKGFVNIHAITDGELNQCKVIRTVGIRGRGKAGDKNADMEMDMDEVTKQQYLSDCSIVAFGLSTPKEKWEIKDIKALPPGIPENMATRILEISDLSDDDMNFFRSDRKRAGNNGADDGGVSLVPDPSNTDSDAKNIHPDS